MSDFGGGSQKPSTRVQGPSKIPPEASEKTLQIQAPGLKINDFGGGSPEAKHQSPGPLKDSAFKDSARSLLEKTIEIHVSRLGTAVLSAVARAKGLPEKSTGRPVRPCDPCLRAVSRLGTAVLSAVTRGRRALKESTGRPVHPCDARSRAASRQETAVLSAVARVLVRAGLAPLRGGPCRKIGGGCWQ